VEPAAVLDERSLPGDRQRQEQRVQAGIVKALADLATSCEQAALLGGRNTRQPIHRVILGPSFFIGIQTEVPNPVPDSPRSWAEQSEPPRLLETSDCSARASWLY